MGFFDSSKFVSKKPESGLAKCGACGFHKNCEQPKVPPTTTAAPGGILFIGAAPGVNGDEWGRHIGGRERELLDGLLHELGSDIDDHNFTSATICHPRSAHEPEPVHIDACRPTVQATIRQLKPRVIVPMGKAAVASVIGAEWEGDIYRNKGDTSHWFRWNIPSVKYQAWVCPTLDLTDVRLSERDAVPRLHLRAHLRAALARNAENPPLVDAAALRNRVEVITDPKAARLRMKDLARKEGVLGFDYETTGLKPERPEHRIYSVGFSLNGEDTFSCLVDESCHGALSRVLQNPRLRKVGSNIKFEERWTLCKLGHPVAGWHWDTMLAAHLDDNRGGIASVKFQAYVLLGFTDYTYSGLIKPYLESKDQDANGLNNIHRAPVRDLLSYGGLDALLEYMVMLKQRELLPCWTESELNKPSI